MRTATTQKKQVLCKCSQKIASKILSAVDKKLFDAWNEAISYVAT